MSGSEGNSLFGLHQIRWAFTPAKAWGQGKNLNVDQTSGNVPLLTKSAKRTDEFFIKTEKELFYIFSTCREFDHSNAILRIWIEKILWRSSSFLDRRRLASVSERFHLPADGSVKLVSSASPPSPHIPLFCWNSAVWVWTGVTNKTRKRNRNVVGDINKSVKMVSYFLHKLRQTANFSAMKT